MYVSHITFLRRFSVQLRVGWVLAVCLFGTFGRFALPAWGQENIKKNVLLMVSTPTSQGKENQPYLIEIKENLLDDIPESFDNFYNFGEAGNEEGLAFHNPQDIFPKEFKIDKSMKAKKCIVKSFLKNTEVKDTLQKQKIDYLILTSIYVRQGNVWETRWVFVKFHNGQSFIYSDRDFYKLHQFIDPIKLCEFFNELPEDIVRNFHDHVRPPGLNREKGKTVLVTSCFFHNEKNPERKEVLDLLQDSLPALLPPELSKEKKLKEFKIVAYAFPRKCSEASGEIFKDIIEFYDADYLVSAYMSMDVNQNDISFTITYVPKKINDMKPVPSESYSQDKNAEAVAKHLAKEISTKWPW